MEKDPLYDNALRILKTNGYLTQKDFVETGRMTTPDNFSIKSGISVNDLQCDCLDIMMYIGGFYIQMLSDGSFYFEVDGSSFRSKDMKLVESIMWEYFASKKFNTL